MARLVQLTESGFRRTVRELGAGDEVLAAIVERHGIPGFWSRPTGFATLLLLILEQQVSLASALAAFNKVEARVGGVTSERLLRLSDTQLREDGFSRQKTRYARALAEAVESRELDLEAVEKLDDTSARAALVALPGIGAWTADVYLLSALRRPDVWPVGDLALQESARAVLELQARPSPTELEAIGERWRPHRATAARLLWHQYLAERGRASPTPPGRRAPR